MDKELYDVLQNIDKRLKGIELNLHNLNYRLNMYDINPQKQEKTEAPVFSKEDKEKPLIEETDKETVKTLTEDTKAPVINNEINFDKEYKDKAQRQNTSNISNNINNVSLDNKTINKKDCKNLETFLGKNIMGIVASILIFIGLGLGAVLVFPLLGDTIKFILMILTGIIITSTGYILSNKDPDNKFNLSLLACGTGVIYITAIAGALFFNLYNEMVLFFIIILWGGLILYLSKFQSVLFNIIGQIGVAIAIMLGFININISFEKMTGVDAIFDVVSQNTGYGKALIPILLYTLFAEIIYLLYFKKQKYINNIISMAIFTEAIILIKLNLITSIEYIIIYLIITTIFFIFSIKSDDYSLLSVLFFASIILGKAMTFMDVKGFSVETIIAILFGIIYFTIALNTILRDKSDVPSKEMCKLIILPLSLICLFVTLGNCMLVEDISLFNILGTGLILLPLLILSYIKDKKNLVIIPLIFVGLRILTSIGLPIYSYISSDTELNVGILMDFVIFFILPIIIERLGEERSSIINIVIISSMVNIILLPITIMNINPFNRLPINDIWKNTIWIIIIAFYSYFIKYAVNIKEKFIYIIDMVLLCFSGLIVLFNAFIVRDNHSISNIIAFIIQFALLTLFAVIHTEEELGNKNLRILVCIKYTMLTIILSLIFKSPLIMSFLLLLIALFFIMMGFAKQIKEMRIYGLILSMLSVVKAVMVDLEYGETAWRALGFIACGVICFGISFIYNMIDKGGVFNKNTESKENQYRGF